ncbi:Ankyrin [Mycena sanguinolenta]|uniref:Ankyrin n=1 Tax=Mycena sanguinolenta TaxID=230812 RepID=A0A8H6ZB61_9AGAR|nr:Ankyrin [Mycena sanguinolenta]
MFPPYKWLSIDYNQQTAGAGKTILLSVVVNHLELQPGSIGVACIYLNHKETDAHTISDLLGSLCKQLLVNKPIPTAVKELYHYHFPRGTRPSVDEILNSLRSVVVQYAKIYLVVDALDEYPEEGRNTLLEYLSTIIVGPSIVNLLMTSRPNITLTSFSDVMLLEIQASDDDIRQYVEMHIKKSSRLSRHAQSRPELRDEISSEIIVNVRGICIWTPLTTKNTVSAVRETLRQLPKDLNRAFDSTIERINQQNIDDKQVAHLALIWVAYSKRPLTVPEFLEALAIEPDATTLDVDNLLDINIVLSVCGGLITVDDKLSAVRLVHYTAQHYLDSIQTVQFPDAHTIIASRCFTYLSFEEFPTIDHSIRARVGLIPFEPESLEEDAEDDNDDIPIRVESIDIDEPESQEEDEEEADGEAEADFLKPMPSAKLRVSEFKINGRAAPAGFPFLQYSQYCFQHAADAHGLYLQNRIRSFVKRLCERKSVFASFTVAPWNHPQWPSSPSMLWISAASNMIAVAGHLLAEEALTKNALSLPLRAASYFGHVEMVELLCKFGADLDFAQPGEKYGTVLQVTAIEKK